MKNKRIQSYKIYLFLFLTTLLVACGGGKSTNSETDETEDDEVVGITNGGTTDTPGTGTCVNITSPKVGDTSLIKHVTIVGENSVEVDTKTTYTAFSNTSLSFDSEGKVDLDLGLDTDQLSDITDLLDSPVQTSQTTETFTIANNFINITKSESTIEGGIHSISTYSPPRSAPINEVCEGQTFTQNYTETTTTTSTTLLGTVTGTEVAAISTKNKIEAVNVQKSTPAGTYSTYQLRSEIEDAILTFWFDTETSTLVLLEQRDAATGDLLSTSTLMTLTSQ